MTPYGIGDFVASFKGDSPGHPFRGNQFEGGSGGNANGNDKKNIQNEIIRHYDSMRGDRIGETGKKVKLDDGLYEVGATDIKVEGKTAYRTDRVTLRKQGETFSIKNPTDMVAHLGNNSIYKIDRDESTIKRIQELQDQIGGSQ